MKKIVGIMLLCSVFASCSSEKKEDNRVYYDSNISSITLTTIGGGACEFTVTPDGEIYRISLNSYEGSSVNYQFNLYPFASELFAVVKNIFDKNVDLYDEVVTPVGETGSWTSITIHYETGRSVVIDNISTAGILGDLYYCVVSSCPKLTGVQGIVTYVDLEGGFYGIVTDRNVKLLPTNLPAEFKTDGIRISFDYNFTSNVCAFYMWGSGVELSNIVEIK